MAHLYASFADASLAEKAAGALLDYGVHQEDISLVAHDAYGQTRGSAYGTQAGAALGAGYGVAGDAQYGTTTSMAAGVGRGASNIGDSAVDATKSVGDRLAQVGDKVAGSVSGAFGAEGAAAGYDAAAAERSGSAEVRTGMAGNEAGIHGSAASAGNADTYGSPMATGTATGMAGDLNPMDQGGPDSAVSQGDTATAAKRGISTTTPEDAGEGAVKGTGIGLGVGILASLAALTIPGIGLVLGGGALAAALGATALTAGAGAIAGGATGFLKDQGVPHEAADRYHGMVAGGGAVLSINIPSGDVDQATAEAILSKYGAADVNAY